MTPKSLSGVIFDMDGVLLDSEPFIAEAGCRMLADRYAVQAVHADFLPFVGMGEDRFLGGVAAKYGKTLNLPVDKVYTYEIYLKLIRGKLGPLPGALEFIRKCKARRLKLAVASSADRMKVDGNLAALGLAGHTFDAVITGSDVERKKPDPEIFIAAAKSMGVPAQRCLVVEDAVTGIQAGKAAGAKCLGLCTSFKPEALKQAGADWTAANLAEAPAAATGW
ncbi:MAG: HAD-IA family hydrolase [Tepidisphaeraceae bacterium]|jgi:HAD superfamily hydrolase (TIGR01509 family)